MRLKKILYSFKKIVDKKEWEERGGREGRKESAFLEIKNNVAEIKQINRWVNNKVDMHMRKISISDLEDQKKSLRVE